jgi:hypothetical protein
MIKLAPLLLFIPLSAACQTKKLQQNPVPAPAASPMCCHIKGKIIDILKPDKDREGDICAKYACRARVRIAEVSACGAGVSLVLNAGDTVTMHFTYTLQPTAKLFPEMKVRYPGLKKGNVFTARAEQRLQMGTDGYFVVTAYTRN